jgi:hypothetical protein
MIVTIETAAAAAAAEIVGELLFIKSQTTRPSFETWTIAASGGCHGALHHLSIIGFGRIPIETMTSIVAACNNSCKEMRGEARDAYI